jgi:hypothetical protein
VSSNGTENRRKDFLVSAGHWTCRARVVLDAGFLDVWPLPFHRFVGVSSKARVSRSAAATSGLTASSASRPATLLAGLLATATAV